MPHLVASVVIPTRNREGHLVRCLDALASQSMTQGSFEVIVVDDGSYRPISLDPRRWERSFTLVVARQENRGPGEARNAGVRIARGGIVAFTDDDCLPDASWLPSLVEAVKANPGALVGGSTVNGLHRSLFAETSQLIVDLAGEHFNTPPRPVTFFASNNLACRRDDFLATGGFDPVMRPAAEDRELCDRWRTGFGQLVGAENARIVHFHRQGFVEFSRIHFRYGRGAFLYKTIRALRGSGSMRADLGFHRSVPGRMWRRRRSFPPLRFAAICLALGWWEIVNAAGFLWQWSARSAVPSSPSEIDG